MKKIILIILFLIILSNAVFAIEKTLTKPTYKYTKLSERKSAIEKIKAAKNDSTTATEKNSKNKINNKLLPEYTIKFQNRIENIKKESKKEIRRIGTRPTRKKAEYVGFKPN